MEFRKKKDSLFTEGMTKSGHSIAYVLVKEDKLVFFGSEKDNIIEELVKNKGERYYTKVKQPTRLVFYCNFALTMAMAKELEQSKILHVDSLSNENQQIIAHPVFGFDYMKLENILASFAEKFNL